MSDASSGHIVTLQRRGREKRLWLEALPEAKPTALEDALAEIYAATEPTTSWLVFLQTARHKLAQHGLVERRR
jgi:hypothetical protein